jgi:hypothetical protein
MNDPMPAIRSLLGMPETIDHKAEAEEIMGNLAAPANDPHGAALVHATLALAERQRETNNLLEDIADQLRRSNRVVGL